MKNSILTVFLVCLTVSLFLAGESSAQQAIPRLRTYNITCDSLQLAYIISHFWEDRYLPCEFTDDNEVVLSAQIRIRGESSREYPKKSFKVNFPPEARYDGRDKINLISEWTDPSFSREFLSYELFRQAGLLAPKVFFVRLYINRRYFGLFTDVEQVDEIFLDQRGQNSSSPIYKAADNNATLLPGEIETNLWERQNGDPTNFQPLKLLIDWLQNVPDENFFEGLGNRFDSNRLARAIAVNALIGNTSTYYHNYFLIRFGGETGRWEYVPWDVDKTFIYSGAYLNPPYARSGHQSIGTNELIRRCWLDNQMRELIKANISGLTDSLFTPEFYSPVTDSLLTMLRQAVSEDTAKQHEVNDFIISLGLIPNDVRGRGYKLRELTNALPLPFDTYPATIRPDGVLFRWTPASEFDSQYVDYELQVSRNVLFSQVEWTSARTTETSRILSGLPNEKLYWRVVARDAVGHWQTPLHQFTVLKLDEFSPNGIPAPNRITGTVRIRPAQGIYRANSDIIVEEGGLLEIERGVRIQFADSARLIIRGVLRSVAAPGDSIRFGAKDPGRGWGGIEIMAGGAAEVSYLAMSNAASIAEVDNHHVALIVRPGSTLIMKHSTISGEDQTLVYSDDSNIELDSCKFRGDGTLVDISGGRHTSIRSCQFIGGLHETSYQLHIANHEGIATIARSRFLMGENGISLFNGTGVTIEGCYFDELSQAFEIAAYHSANIANNILLRCTSAIQISDVESPISIWNCNFVKCKDLISGMNVPRITFTNSVFWLIESQIQPTFLDANNAPIYMNYCLSDQLLAGQNNILDMPHFEKPWDTDFTPEPDSPLIDAGQSDGAPVTDFYGRPRWNTPGRKNKGAGRYEYYDIGAVEYPVGTATPPAMNGRLMTIYPNPANDRAEVVFEIEVVGKARLRLFDVTGREIGSRHLGELSVGQYRLAVEELTGGTTLASGIYFCVLEQLSGSSRTKLIVIR